MSDFPINILIYLEARGMLERLDSYHDVPYSFQAARFSPFRMEGTNGMVRIAPNSADASTDMRRALDHVDPLLFQFKDEIAALVGAVVAYEPVGYGFLRSGDYHCLASPDDIYVGIVYKKNLVDYRNRYRYARTTFC
jgi:hypothetical protein